MRRKQQQHRYTYSHLDVLMASATEPIEEEKRTYQLLRIYQGLRALEQDQDPEFEDWILCSDAVNLTEALVEMGVCEDASGLLDEAAQALGRAGQRHLDGKPIRLDGPGLAAVRSVVANYAELLAVVSKRTILAAHRRAELRLQQIRAGKTRPHDINIKKVRSENV